MDYNNQKNTKTIEELIKENETLKNTIKVQQQTISRLLNAYVLKKSRTK